MGKSLISVIMTAYNEEKYIGEAIENILAQTYTNFELIIVDDGSTDGTSVIVKSFNDQRIRYYQLPKNQGVGAAHAFAMEKANGEIIAIADADDIHLPERFAKQLAYLQEHADVGVVDSYVEYFADNELIKSTPRYQYIMNYRQKHIDRITTSEDYKRSLYWFCSVVHSASMFYKELVMSFNYSHLTVNEDYEVFYKMNKRGVVFAKVLEVLVKMRINSNSTTLAQDNKLLRSYFTIKEEEINNLIKNNSHIYIWGTGQGGIDTARILKEKGTAVAGFLDNNEQKIGETIEDIRVVDYRNIVIKASGILIVSSIGKFEIVKQLEAQGLQEFDDFLVLV